MKKIFSRFRRQEPAQPLVLHRPEVANPWPGFSEEEGQLAVDIYQTEEAVIVKSTIAGATAADIDVSLVDDILTIKGRREADEHVAADAYLYRECYWGRFSRTIILPFELKNDKVNASLDNGVLTVVLPKARRSKETSIRVKDARER